MNIFFKTIVAIVLAYFSAVIVTTIASYVYYDVVVGVDVFWNVLGLIFLIPILGTFYLFPQSLLFYFPFFYVIFLQITNVDPKYAPHCLYINLMLWYGFSMYCGEAMVGLIY